ncbi:O-methyltransferase [Capnocytophaga canimorsus]|uniref:O-methyltransferase n=1 Tax=Capnocytophaga canimorsus TaxID=28188 RepID=A0A0B7GZR5_9FLAO|nr:O-methyltransferase [Capnocytophaga canimorsus]ATA76556.1 O-methyltransferase [Capnocytophaga canimorsus]PJI77320.1 caffeoyl-CoA O-methyltransferase [Capnocytophaga canimorsus]CEN32776.1 O-methyltransferase [Capnocytophaga canimorsus]STA71717.1 Putative O-methyltransferase MSMEG_5073 [Capnocytophaga canimorsus]
MHFISPTLEQYVEAHSQSEPPLLQELSRRTHLNVLQPRMLSGHFQGRVLSLISKLIRPKTILEIGTYTGYATLCLAEGLSPEGIIHTIDVNEELQDLQREFFDRSGKGSQIVQHLGAAADIIPTLDANFDLVFIDADKQNYALYFDLIINKMRSGGIILSDNVLWSGKVVSPIKSNDKQTLAIDLYNKKINNDPRVETVLLPIRDGLTVSRVV